MHEHVKSEFDKVLSVGVIEPATSEWTSPVVFAPKGGTLHVCMDYRKLNWKTLSDTFPLPRMDDFIDSPGIASIFCTLDCTARDIGKYQLQNPTEIRLRLRHSSVLIGTRKCRLG